jgi:hypothetical protein
VAKASSREINVQVKSSYLTMTWWLLVTTAALALARVAHEGNVASTGLAMAAEARPFKAEAPAGQSADTDKPQGGAAVVRGMGKEAVRTVWGHPEEIRKIRTCFGWQEEWVYRGDPKRVGGSERILLFDEGEVLRDIK